MPATSAPEWLPAAAVVLAALALFGFFSTEMADPDAWWHLRTGQYILTQHHLPVPDPFAWTTKLAPPESAGAAITQHFNLTHEWFAQALMYLLYTAGGAGALVVWKALLLLMVCALPGWVAARRTGDWWWGVACALATASLAQLFTADRPALLTFFFVAAMLAVLESGRRLWLLPLCAVVWANSHGGFFLGWVVCGAYCAEALLKRTPDLRRLLGWTALTVLVSGLNPNGFRVVETLLLYRQNAVISTLLEWSKPYLWGPPYAFDILLYCAAIVLVLAWRRVRIADWLLFAAFSVAALTAFRNIILIAILAPMLIATYFPVRFQVPLVLRYVMLGALAVLLGSGAVRGTSFQLRGAEWRYPAGAAQFLFDHHITAPIFNSYEYGGYLMWRGLPVFIDGRVLSESVYQDYRRILGSSPGDAMRPSALARYRVGAIVVNSFEYTSGVLYPLVPSLYLSGDNAWKLVYEDPQAMVFLRDVPPGMPVLDRGRVMDHLAQECELHVTRDPEFSLCARNLADHFLRTGERARAIKALALYLEHPYDDDPRPRQVYQQLLMQR